MFRRSFAAMTTQRSPLLLLALLAFLAFHTSVASAQFPYTLETDSSSYVDLVGSPSLAAPGWDDPEFSVELGFDFPFFGQMTSGFSQMGLGNIMGTPVSESAMDFFIPGAYDLADLSTVIDEDSKISYLLEGTPGAYVFKIEWRNCGFYEEVFEGDDNSTFSSRYNAQVWLYEASGVIEYRYGLIDIQFETESLSTPIGLAHNLNGDDETGDMYVLSGDESEPYLLLTTLEEFLFSGLTSHPSFGRIYRFTPAIDAIDEASSALPLLDLYPNPATDHVQFDLGPKLQTWRAVDLTGRTLASGTGQGLTHLDLTNFAQGTYILQVAGFAPAPLVIR
jgi:hypothetical protein